MQIADAVTEAIRRTEDRAAARYEKALALLVQALDPSLDDMKAEEKARDAWSKAGTILPLD